MNYIDILHARHVENRNNAAIAGVGALAGGLFNVLITALVCALPLLFSQCGR